MVFVVFPVAGLGQGLDRRVDDLGWLAGCWELRSGGTVVVEMWMPPAGGMMLGASRTVSNGQVRASEKLMMVDSENGMNYVADPSGQTLTTFPAVAVTDTSFTVENLQHDFPQRISYFLVADDSLVARVWSPERQFQWEMARISCRVD
jgi:hypothetical protein